MTSRPALLRASNTEPERMLTRGPTACGKLLRSGVQTEIPGQFRLAPREDSSYKSDDIAVVVAAMTESEPGAESERAFQSTLG